MPTIFLHLDKKPPIEQKDPKHGASGLSVRYVEIVHVSADFRKLILFVGDNLDARKTILTWDRCASNVRSFIVPGRTLLRQVLPYELPVRMFCGLTNERRNFCNLL